MSFILVFAKWPTVWTDQPHKIVLFVQPVLILLLLVMLQGSFASHLNFLGLFYIPGPVLHISLAMLAFFATALVCHGEMAKDRPDPRHLTEFYLWMSVGGMVGGMFNGLVAPLLFWGVAEFPWPSFWASSCGRACLGLAGPKTPWNPILQTWSAGSRTRAMNWRSLTNNRQPTSNYALSYFLDFALPCFLGMVSFGLLQISLYFLWPYDHDSNSLYKFFRTMKFSADNAIFLALRTNDLIVTFFPLLIAFLLQAPGASRPGRRAPF